MIDVLLVCDRLDGAGGVERMVCQLAAHWAGLGHRVAVASVATPAQRLHYPLPPAVRVLQALPTGHAPADAAAAASAPRGRWQRRLQLARREAAAGRALAALLRRERPEVVVLNGLTTACSVLAWAPGWAPRAVCCDHNHFDARSRPWRLARRLLYPRAAAVVSLTEADRARFAALNPRTEVIANASALQAAAPARPRPGQVLAVGRCVAQKGLDLLLQAWVAVLQAHPHARLHVVGDGPLRPALQAQADRLGIAASVHWHGTASDMRPHYEAAALFVLPSRYEGMPLALLEAQALGVPAVAFDCPTGPREVLGVGTEAAPGLPPGVEAGPGGLLVPPGDVATLAAALGALLADPAWRDRLAHGAWRRSREAFDPQRQLARWTALLERVATRTGRLP